jgi:hypothetical protein
MRLFSEFGDILQAVAVFWQQWIRLSWCIYEYGYPYNGSGHSILQQQRRRDPLLEGLGSPVSSRVGFICFS